ncbi:MAG TPA: hypothetical protein VFB58_18575 [Chloroflexota bacterium]|nr:hypothetical protein [Chloroflexota bacterium]
MTLIRAGFLAALVLAILGFAVSRYLVSTVMSQAPIAAYVPPRATPTSSASPTPHPSPRPAPTKSAIHLPRVTPTPARPTPTPTSGTVTLARYWINATSARRSQAISMGYVVNNGTGRAVRLLLGASIKATRTASWLNSISDPVHDMSVLVRPGVSTYSRPFQLSASLRPGLYDVAWGLRSSSGARLALVTAPASLTVRR